MSFIPASLQMPRATPRSLLAPAFTAALIFLSAPGAAGAQSGVPGASPIDLQKGAQIAQGACAACHGPDGNSALPANPKLAGQHFDYLVKQLHNFRPGTDGKPATRVNAIMAGFAATLSEEDIRNVSAYYASQPHQYAVATDGALVAQGQKIWRSGIPDKGVPSCAGCHGPSGAGIPAQYPYLKGQWAEYTVSQLKAFRDGTRQNNQSMTTIAQRLSDAEMKALGEYAAGLR